MTPDDNWVLPSRYWLRDTIQDNGLTEDSATENVSDSAVRAPPHLLQLELLHTRLIGRDGRALDTHTVLLDGLGRLDGNLVARL